MVICLLYVSLRDLFYEGAPCLQKEREKKMLVYIVFGLLLQRSCHILETHSCGVVAIPRHAPEGGAHRQEVERDRLGKLK